VKGEPFVVSGESPFGSSQADPDSAAAAPVGAWSAVTRGTPNFAVSSAGPSAFGAVLSLRGLSNTPYFSDPAVAVYLDNIPLGSGFSYPSDLFGFGPATVLAGPHPADTGRAGDGGTVLFSPPGGRRDAELSVGMGNFGMEDAGLLAGGTADGADMRGSALATERGGTIRNSQIGQSVDTLRSFETFERVAFRPAHNLAVTAEAFYDRHRDGAAPLVPLGGPLFTVSRAEEGATDTDLLGASVLASVETAAGSISSDTSFTRSVLDPYGDWLVLPPALKSVIHQSQTLWNEELRLVSPASGGAPWSVGAWFSGGPTAGDSDRSLFGSIPIEVSSYRYERREAALFGSLEVRLPLGIALTLGARAQEVEKDYHQDEQVPVAGLRLAFRRRDPAFLPKLSLSRRLGAGTVVDMSASEGGRPGGFSAYTDKAALVPFAPERVAAFEAGVRLEPGSALSLGVRAFDDEIWNDQIERSFTATDYLVADAARARSLGAEATLEWRPVPRVTLGISAGINDARILDFSDPVTGLRVAAGKAPYAPAGEASATLAFRDPSGFFASVTGTAVGRTYYTETEDAAYSQAPYGVLDGRAGFAAARFRITAYVSNAANRGYYSLIIPGVNSAAPGAPRTFGTEVSYRF
jgi:hypothetical protein